MSWDEEEYYEPSLADEIIAEYTEKMKLVLTDAIKQDLEKLRRENDVIKKKYELLKNRQEKVYLLSRQLESEKNNLKHIVRQERLGELLKDFNPVRYHVFNSGKKIQKCNKCNDQRQIFYETPLGRITHENCNCDKSYAFYEPKLYECIEFKIDDRNYTKGKLSMLMWYRLKREKDYDYYNYANSTFCEAVYQDGMDFEKLDKSETFFNSLEDCQKYCDWLNSKVEIPKI